MLAVYDPPAKTGRSRIHQRLAMDALIYRIRTGCQWNHLPAEFGWGMSVYLTFRRWEEKGIFNILWALLILECEELGGVDWRWQAADGCLGKARGVPRAEKGALATPASASFGTRTTAARRPSRRASLSRGRWPACGLHSSRQRPRHQPARGHPQRLSDGTASARVGREAAVSHCRPHTFRHAFPTQFLLAGGSRMTLMDLMGHTTVAMTRRYVRFTSADIQAQAARFSPVLALGEPG